MRKINVVILVLLGAVCSPVVFAFQLGIFDLKPIVSIQEKFDDNISSASTNKISDFITTLTLALEGVHETKVDNLSFKVAIEPKIFAKESERNTTSEYVDLKYKHDFTRFDRVLAENHFTHADESTSLSDEFGRAVSDRYDYYKNFLSLGYVHDFTEQLTGKLKYANEYYDPTVSTVSNSVLNRPGIEMDYAFSTQTIGSVYYDYSNRAFNPGGSVIIHGTAAGVRQFFSNQLYLDLKAGADFITTADDKDTIRPNYSAALTNEINETTQAGIAFNKSHAESFSSSDLFDKWSVAVFWSKALAERVQFTGAAFSGGGTFASGSKENFNGINLGVGYEVRKNVKANLGYSFIIRDSSQAAQEYDKNTVSMGVTVDF